MATIERLDWHVNVNVNVDVNGNVHGNVNRKKNVTEELKWCCKNNVGDISLMKPKTMCRCILNFTTHRFTTCTWSSRYKYQYSPYRKTLFVDSLNENENWSVLKIRIVSVSLNGSNRGLQSKCLQQ